MRIRAALMLVVSGITLLGSLLSWASSFDAARDDGVRPEAGPTSDPWAEFREELAASPGAEIARGDVAGHPWALRMFEDRSNSIDGAGPNLYIDSEGSIWLDRPDPGAFFDSIWHAEARGPEVLVVIVATSEVARVVLRSDDESWEAQRIEPDESAAFDVAFWVEGASESAPFVGEIVAYGADGGVLQIRRFSTDPDAPAG